MMKVAAMLGMMVALAGPVRAQDVVFPGMPGIEAGAKPNGVFHGNYCGIGNNGPGLPPTDALDRACMHHDACTPTGGLPSCACNARFARETRAVLADPNEPEDTRALADMVEASIPIIPCRR